MNEAGIQVFYERFLAFLDAAGVPVVILGGQAMLRHRLAETTKDTERDLINEIVPSEWAPTLAAARRLAAHWD